MPRGLTARINLGLLLFVVALGVATAALVYWGFGRTREDAVDESRAGLEAQGLERLRDFTELQAAIGGLQLEPAAGFAHRAAQTMYLLKGAGVTFGFDPVSLEVAPNGTLVDGNPGRVSDAVSLGELNPERIRDLRDSLALDSLAPAYFAEYAGGLPEPNFQPIAVYFIGVSGVSRYYPPLANFGDLDPDIEDDLAMLFARLGPEENPDRGTVWTPLYEDETGRGLVITAYVPAYEGQALRGVIGVDLSVDRLIDQVNMVGLTPSGFAFYIDSEGHLMQTDAAPLLEAELAAGNEALAALVTGMNSGEAGVGRVEIGGRETFIAYAPLTNVGGSFAVGSPVDELTAQASVVADAIEGEANRTVGVTLLAMAGLFAVTLLISAWVTRRQLLRPIAELVGATRRLAAGDVTATTQVGSRDELGELSDSFNEMAGQVRARSEALAEREAQYRSVFEAASDALFITGDDYAVLEANPAALALTGYTLAELRALPALGLLPAGYQEESREVLGTFEGLGDIETRTLLRRSDGSTVLVSVMSTTFGPASLRRRLVSARDITEQVHREQELERRVEERTSELVALNAETASRVRQLEAAAAVASSFTVEQSLDATLTGLAEQIVGSTGAVACAVAVAEAGPPRRPRLVGTAGLPEGFAAAMEQAYLAGAPSRTLGDLDARRSGLVRKGRTEGMADPRYGRAQELLAGARWDSLLTVPIVYRDRALGMVIACYEPDAEPDAPEVAFVQAIADQAAVAMENATLYRQAASAAALEERQRLARELHDSVSQALYGIGLGARTAKRRLGPEADAGVLEPVDYILSLAETGLTEMRSLIFELRPEAIEQEGLTGGVRRQAAAVAARHGVAVELELGEEPDLPLPSKEAAFRIVQEALHNAVKHARASTLTVRVRVDGEAVTVEVRDDGVGFDAGGEFPGHLGLTSMRERAAGMGGSLEVRSAPGEGTTVRLQIG